MLIQYSIVWYLCLNELLPRLTKLLFFYDMRSSDTMLQNEPQVNLLLEINELKQIFLSFYFLVF